MIHAEINNLETPRTKIEDATHSSLYREFDITEEQSFRAPVKSKKIYPDSSHGIQSNVRDWGAPGARPPLSNRAYHPGPGKGEFTPLLRDATRNRALLYLNKDKTVQTPAYLKHTGIDSTNEDYSPVPDLNATDNDTKSDTFIASTPFSQPDSNSTTSIQIPESRKKKRSNILANDAKLSLREQESLVDQIRKENFALKLKIHFLEDALVKSGDGYKEAILKENTELKVDKVTMQKELVRLRKTLTTAEQETEQYQQQLAELKEKTKHRSVGDDQQRLKNLNRTLKDKDEEIKLLKNNDKKVEEFQDKIYKLQVDLLQKQQALNDRACEIDNLQGEIEKRDAALQEKDIATRKLEGQIVELEEKAKSCEKSEKMEQNIRFLEEDQERIKSELQRTKNECQDALTEKNRAEQNLKELQDEMVNNSMTTKGFTHQIEENANRIRDELKKSREEYDLLNKKYMESLQVYQDSKNAIDELKMDNQLVEQKYIERIELVSKEKETAIRERNSLFSSYEKCQNDFRKLLDEKNEIHIRFDTLTNESASLQRELDRYCKMKNELEVALDQEKSLGLKNERDVKNEYQSKINHLVDKLEDMKARFEEKERIYGSDFETWTNEKRNLEKQKDIIEEKAAGLQRTINRLQETEGNLSSKEAKLQEALKIETDRHHNQETNLNRQINELNGELFKQQQSLADANLELTKAREELRLSQREQKQLAEKAEGLEDEVEVLQANLDEETEEFNKEIFFAKTEADKLRQQIMSIKSDLTKAETAAFNAQAEIEEYRASLLNGEGSKDQLNSRLKECEEKLTLCRQEKRSLQDQVNRIDSEAHSLRVTKVDLEAENTEIKSQLKILQEQKETLRCDQERIDVISSKLKLESELRNLREENKVIDVKRQAAEKSLENEIAKANETEIRLSNEIHDLHKKLRSSSEKRELSLAKNKILQLESQISELENQLVGGENNDDNQMEVSYMYRNLMEARKKETEFAQREATQREVIRGLKKQITNLERKLHETEISLFQKNAPGSPHDSSNLGELNELRSQLINAHQNLRDLRNQLKDSENEAKRKAIAADKDFQIQLEAWEAEKDEMSRSIDRAELAREELQVKNCSAETTISRLRSKIERLEKALKTERLNSGENRTIVLERKDLHEMLRESQMQAEALDLLLQERDSVVAGLMSTETELRAQLKLMREELTQLRSKISPEQEQIEQLQQKFRIAKEKWELERKNLTRGVRFANMSLSVSDESLQQKITSLELENEERIKKHQKELRGVGLQLEWLRAKCKREEFFRAEAAFAKRFMGLQIALFEAWLVNIISIA